MSPEKSSPPDVPRKSSEADRVSRFLHMQEAMGWPVVLGPGVREPSVPVLESMDGGFVETDADSPPIEGSRYIRYAAHEDGTWEITFDPA